MSAVPRRSIASRGNRLASAVLSEPHGPGRLSGRLHLHVPVAIERVTGAISPAPPQAPT